MPPVTDDLVPASALIPTDASVSLEDLRQIVTELHSVLTFLIQQRTPFVPLPHLRLEDAEASIRRALALLPGWLLEEAP